MLNGRIRVVGPILQVLLFSGLGLMFTLAVLVKPTKSDPICDTDLTGWTEYAANPVFDPATNRAFTTRHHKLVSTKSC